MSLFPNAPPTATPNSLSLSPDGQTLLVANADTNTVAVVDVSNGGRSFVNGFIPTGWYPTGAIFSRDGKQIFVLSGKGLVSAAKPTDDAGIGAAAWAPCRRCRRRIGSTLADYTRKVLP